MTDHIKGPLYYERMGRTGPVMAFVHPNPMDQSCWIFQMAHMSTWFRCIAIDIPGYGRSPTADAGLTMSDLAESCWGANKSAFALQEQIPNCELRILHGAGHACHLEQPWLFDRLMLTFLRDRGLVSALDH
jgi:pimeloyl-ACP methyl ester carboxylesterase